MSEFETISEAAKAHHRAGELQQALDLYRQALILVDDDADLWSLHGAACFSLGEEESAMESFRRAIDLNPIHPQAHHGLGSLLASRGQFDEAIACFEMVLRFLPRSAETRANLNQALADRDCRQAAALAAAGRVDDALEVYRRALEAMPDHVSALGNIGDILAWQDKHDEAAECFRRVLEIQPNSAPAHYELGRIAFRQQRLAAAEEHFEKAIALDANNVDALTQLGTLRKQSQPLAAIELFRRALTIDANHYLAMQELARLIYLEGGVDESVSLNQTLLQFRPDSSAVHYNLAMGLAQQHKHVEALEAFRSSARLDPNFIEAEVGYAMTLLSLGRFTEGWEVYEHRLRVPDPSLANMPSPRWDGSDLAGKTILLTDEQGHGDNLQFVRYAELAKKLGARVIVGCRPVMSRLFSTCPWIDEIVVGGEVMPQVDCYISLLSLPAYIQTTIDNVPCRVPYLWPSQQEIDEWHLILGEEPALKVGIAWQGSVTNNTDSFRSFPLAHFERLARIPGVKLYSLQFGAGTEQLAEVAGRWPIENLSDRLGDFHHTAAAICNLDLVITCDSVLGHLSGAIGRPVWVALSFSPDWRWMLDRGDSPWYPTMRLFRQPKLNDWNGVFDQIEQALVELVRSR